jgi:hypothetical protein
VKKRGKVAKVAVMVLAAAVAAAVVVVAVVKRTRVRRQEEQKEGSGTWLMLRWLRECFPKLWHLPPPRTS